MTDCPSPETLAQMRQYALDEIDGDDFRHKRDFLTGAVLPFRPTIPARRRPLDGGPDDLPT